LLANIALHVLDEAWQGYGRRASLFHGFAGVLGVKDMKVPVL
jgi:hypothetical protein